MLLCDRCHKNMEADDGRRFVGITFDISWDESEKGKKYSQFIYKQLGKYKPLSGSTIMYHFCYECWLDSLFLTPDESLVFRKLNNDSKNASENDENI